MALGPREAAPGESLFGTRKADLVIRLYDGRAMPTECKVSNSSTNSRAMPTESLAAGLEQSATWPDLVWHMKVPESWVRFRLAIAHPAERALLERACRWAGRGEHSA